MQVTVYFDYISPYAYLGWTLTRRHQEIRWRPQPVLFAGLLNHWRQLGPAEIPPKRAFTFKDAVRRAARLGVPIGVPAGHPFNPLLPLRLSQHSVAGDQQAAVIDACYRAIWVDGVNPMDPAALAKALEAAGLDGSLVDRAQAPAVKAELRKATQAAIDAGVFGVPTFAVRDEHFFGHDKLDDVFAFMAGGDPVSADMRAAIAAMPTLANRR